MEPHESTIERLESAFPSKADAAFAAAYKRSLSAGISVTIARNGILWRVHPDGTRERIGKTAKPSGKRYPVHISLK